MNITWKNCFKIGVSAFALYLCIYYWGTISGWLSVALGAATPVFIGFAIAYVLNLLMSFYERHYFPKSTNRIAAGSRRGVCLVAAMLTFVAIVALVVYLVVPKLVSCVTFLVAEIPPLIEQLLQSEWVNNLLPADTVSMLASVDWMTNITKIVQTVGSGIGGAVNAVVSALTSVVSVIVTAFISIIFSIYLLYGKDTLQRQGRRLVNTYLPEKHTDKLMHCLSVLNDCFHRFIVGQFTEAVILGLLCFVGMLIFRFPYAGMIGTLIGFTALIPVAGAYIGAGVGAVMILTESPVKALLFLVFIVVLQQLEGNIIYPRVVGNSIGLPAIWVLAAVTIGGSLMGIIGMLLGVPIAAALYRLIREDVHRRNEAVESEK